MKLGRNGVWTLTIWPLTKANLDRSFLHVILESKQGRRECLRIGNGEMNEFVARAPRDLCTGSEVSVNVGESTHRRRIRLVLFRASGPPVLSIFDRGCRVLGDSRLLSAAHEIVF
jgi:hypothetical protein